MIAKLEKGYYNLYDEKNEIIGKIKIANKSNYNESELTVGEKVYKIVRKDWAFKVYENDKVVYNLKTNSFTGNITVLELDKKIKGVFSLRWGTQLVDEENNTLLKIKNKNMFLDKGIHIIEIENQNVSDFEILLALFGHLYGSALKTRGAIIS